MWIAPPEMWARTVTGPRFSGDTVSVRLWSPSGACASETMGVAIWVNSAGRAVATTLGAAAVDTGVAGVVPPIAGVAVDTSPVAWGTECAEVADGPVGATGAVDSDSGSDGTIV